ncbi:MAG: hypothetical protein FWE20_10515 [Defluviitaleaceae bacterium]|nr:hypothetical protein [Defluviitaleaceae bacterium]
MSRKIVSMAVCCVLALLLSGCAVVQELWDDAVNPEVTTATIGLGESVVFQGFEMSVGDTLGFATIATGEVVARVPITFTNVGSTRNWPDTPPRFNQVWNPSGISVSAIMQRDPSAIIASGADLAGSDAAVTLREGSSYSTVINFLYRESGVYEIQYSSGLMWEGEIHRVYIQVNADRFGTASQGTQTAEAPQGTADQAAQAAPAPAVQAGILDERLFDVWVAQIEGLPPGFRIVRGFEPDGTGYWWGDGPGQSFTWSVHGGVLTMDVRCDEFRDEWTEVYSYEISGDTLTFTHADGWQSIYIRESAAPEQSFEDTSAADLVGAWTFREAGDALIIDFFESGRAMIQIESGGSIIESELVEWFAWPAWGTNTGTIDISEPDGTLLSTVHFELLSNDRLLLDFSDGEPPMIFSR